MDGAFGYPPRELVVMMRSQGISLEATTAERAAAAPSFLHSVMVDEKLRFEPLFGMDGALAAAGRRGTSAMESMQEPEEEFFLVQAGGPEPLADERLDALAERLAQLPEIAAAYVKPPALPPVRPPSPDAFMGHSPVPNSYAAPGPTPPYVSMQGYLDPAPGGIDARYAWTRSGGTGKGVKIADVEGDWRLTHESLKSRSIAFVHGRPVAGWRDHGTAVIGEIAGDGTGVLGIAHDSIVKVVSFLDTFSGASNTARAIDEAATRLDPGDILLIELHRPGPRFGGQIRVGQEGYIAVEWWPDDFRAIRRAVNQGIIVVEAAGNGAESLDDTLYDRPMSSFGTGWSNPFRRGAYDSGAILVGAGAPSPGDHQEPDRSRLSFSNYGDSVDAQGWGDAVVTCGYGDLRDDPDEDVRYTRRFGGTSGASPIVVGAIACLQGIRRAAGQSPLTPTQVRHLLRSNGSPQQSAPGRPATQRIGPRPDLRNLISIMQSMA